MNFRYWIAAFCLIGFQHPSLGHAVWGVVENDAVGVRFVYDGGAPLRAADVKVTSLAPGEISAIEGLTDRDGRFAFFPDQPGEWRVEVNDGMGHRASLVVDVGEERVAVVAHEHAHGHHVAPWLMAISMLFGLFGIWTLWSTRRSASPAKQG